MRLVAIFLLGGLQGAVGWWMVKSGLIDDPRVSHVRLSIHLGIAFVIYAAMLWTALDLLSAGPGCRHEQRHPPTCALWERTMRPHIRDGAVRRPGRRDARGIRLQHLSADERICDSARDFDAGPWWENFLHNMATVQFNHRLIAWALVLAIPAFWLMSRRTRIGGRARFAADLLLATLGVQVALGMTTLLLGVPIPAGRSTSGGGAAALLTGAVDHSRTVAW